MVDVTVVKHFTWSTDYNYLAIDLENPDRMINIYDFTGKLIVSISDIYASENDTNIGEWLNNHQFIYNQVQTPVSTTLNSSIVLMSIYDNSNIEIKTIKESDSKNQYLFLSPRGENTISFEKITYKYKTIGSDGFASTLEKNTTYWRMDLDGKNLMQITEYDATV